MMVPLLVRRGLLPMADLLRRRRLSAVMDELDGTQWWTRERLLEQQDARVANLIAYAAARVPYYTDVFRSRGIDPGTIRGQRDLARLPLLTREAIRAGDAGRMLAAGVSRAGWGEGRTGGSSTGEPLFFMYDRGTLDYGRAVFYRGCAWAGGPPGTPTLEVWGSPVRRPPAGERIKTRLTEGFLRRQRLNAFRFDDAAFAGAAARLAQGRIVFIEAYVSALEELARYLRTRGIRPLNVRGVLTTAEVLTPDTREFLKQTFEAPVFDAYGCGEINGIAYECDRHAGLHVGMERAVVEIVDEAGVPVPEGTPGRLAITDLHNRAMPLIRYVNGDEARLSHERCACGRASDRLLEILGRTCDLVDGLNGRTVHSYFFASMFGALGWSRTLGLQRFQIVQRDARTLVVRLAMPAAAPADEERRLRAMLAEYLGPMDFRLDYCQAIEAEGSGKLRWTMNELRSAGKVS